MRLERAVEAWIESLSAGNYRATCRTALGEFVAVQHERDVERLADLSVTDCRQYAKHLRTRARDADDELSAASARGPYFTAVRSFLAWCVDEEWLETNPARPNRVRDELPEQRSDGDRQFWERRHREAILTFTSERVHGGNVSRERALRDYAVVALLGLTGIRGAELFADPRDDVRNGLRWNDVDLTSGVATVFGKARETEHVAVPSRVVDVLERHRHAQKPPDSDWPVVPTAHRPSLSRTVRARLADRGWDDEAVESALEDETSINLMRREGVTPPALSKNGGRNLMQRLSTAAGVDVDGEYLKPHGGRRGLGSLLYERDAELAQETLRHRSVATTHEAYRQKKAERRRERLDDVL